MKPIVMTDRVHGGIRKLGRPLALAFAMGLLLLSVISLKIADVLTAAARTALTQAQAKLTQTEIIEKIAIAKAAQVTQAKALLQLSADAGYSSRNWDARRFNMKQVAISRESMNTLLGEISRSPERHFAAEQFELSVKRQDESLFLSPVDPGSDLILTLKGTLLFRAKKEFR